jgi:lysophospholipase L1-like esterase
MSQWIGKRILEGIVGALIGGTAGALACWLFFGGPVSATVLKRVLFVGDSITADLSVTGRNQYPELVGRQMRNVLVQNAGKPAATMANLGYAAGWGTNRYIVQMLDGVFALNTVVILLGTNDWAESIPVASFEAAYTMFVAAVPPGVNIVCVTPTWRRVDGQANKVGETLDDVRAAVSRACAGHTIVDGSQAIPHAERFFQDGLHPNAMGNRYLARAVASALGTLR